MKKQTTKKIISFFIIFILIVSVFQNIPSVNAANESSIGNLYSNPNQSNKFSYKFKIKDVVNSTMLTNVVGCTGIVNRVSAWMLKFVQSPFKMAKAAEEEFQRTKAQLVEACKTVKAAEEGGAQSIPVIGGLAPAVDTALSKIEACKSDGTVKDDKAIKEAIDAKTATTARDFKEQCFDGIAITLAKNQLTALTRSAMNWVNSGYGGNPFFVQNMQNLTNKIERNVIETGIDVLLNPGNENPYARDFAKSTIYTKGIVSSSAGFLGGLSSSLENFVTDPQSYYTDEQLQGAQNTETALQKARRMNDAFARDFSLGGWNGWLALTQKENNNPLGFNMVANQYLAEMQANKVSEQKSELAQNNGFMSQKECMKWVIYNTNGSPKRKTIAGSGSGGLVRQEIVFSNSKPSPVKPEDGYGDCVDWKITTPGSLIKDKVTNYLNSPERQLELAKTINDSLNALFSVIISKLQQGGLSSLSDSTVTTNWTDNMNTLISGDSSQGYNNNGAYGNFNLTRDLGNTFIHEPVSEVGTWDASQNITNTKEPQTGYFIKLYPDTEPKIYKTDGSPVAAYNIYYRVTFAGKSKLMNDGYNDWQIGDRAFWDGEKWQNWKCGPNAAGECKKQISPIKNRGVIQIQEDYIVAAKEILKILPNLMPKLGELDYCLPGPNPSYKTNSTGAQSAYSDWVGTMYVGATDSTNERWGVEIDKEGDRTYEDLHDIYPNPSIWNFIRNDDEIIDDVWRGMNNLIYEFSNICNSRGKSGKDCSGNYTYIKNGNFTSGDALHIGGKQDTMDKTIKYVSSYLFQDFYTIFDKKMTDIYFKDMTSLYLEYENKDLDPENDKNPGYIKMAESGLDFTKNITFYDEDIKTARTNYTESIAQTKVNIAKLEPIKAEVSAIIKAAQDRRNKKMIEAQNNTESAKAIASCNSINDTCMADATDVIGFNQNIIAANKAACKVDYDLCISKIKTTDYLADYASCFAEENMQFYDADGLIYRKDERGTGCSDGIDNDMDGLVDIKDPDCAGYGYIAPPNVGGRPKPPVLPGAKDAPGELNYAYCSPSGTRTSLSSGTPEDLNFSCEERTTSNACTNGPSVYLNPKGSYISETCVWNP